MKKTNDLYINKMAERGSILKKWKDNCG